LPEDVLLDHAVPRAPPEPPELDEIRIDWLECITRWVARPPHHPIGDEVDNLRVSGL
jgi:hypothetical protein